jgi:enoyl-CoA hydratase/carnithine racemase
MSAVRRADEGGLAVLTVDKPPLNLYDRALFDELSAAVDELHRAAPRCLLVRAEGKVVSGGADVSLFGGMTPADGRRLWIELVDLLRRIEALPFPTVFAAHGLTLTAAFEIALACDLIVAAESARFGLVEAVVGLSPGMGGTQRLAERAGPGRARELVYTGDLYDAETLAGWGVVNRVWPDEELAERAAALARRLAEGPTRAHAATKRVVRAFLDGGVPLADQLLPVACAPLFATEDLRGAVETFLRDGPGRARFAGR